MKIKHNKKRNVAFVYEALVKEITVAVIKNDVERKEKAISVVKKHFSDNSILKKQLDCYRSLYETKIPNKQVCEKIIKEARLAHRMLDPQSLFTKQTELIDDINKEVSPNIFNNFVPNYKTLATIYQMFSTKNSPKNTVIMESHLIDHLYGENAGSYKMEPVDNIVLNSFVDKFNEKYSTKLTTEQNQLLNLYIMSFSDNSLALKSYLNEEITRLKTIVQESRKLEEFISDKEMDAKAEQIIKKLDSFKSEQINESVISTVLKTQALTKELIEDVSND